MPSLQYHSVPPLSASDLARFWSKVSKTDGCWPFRSALTRGYGRIGLGHKVYLAHRVSLAIATGEDLAGVEVCHKCDNPICVRPDHLFRGDRAANVRDMFEKGRGRPRGGVYSVGEAHHNAVLNDDLVRQMRARHAEGASFRQIARDFRVERRTATAAIKGETWKHLTPDEQATAKRA